MAYGEIKDLSVQEIDRVLSTEYLIEASVANGSLSEEESRALVENLKSERAKVKTRSKGLLLQLAQSQDNKELVQLINDKVDFENSLKVSNDNFLGFGRKIELPEVDFDKGIIGRKKGFPNSETFESRFNNEINIVLSAELKKLDPKTQSDYNGGTIKTSYSKSGTSSNQELIDKIHSEVLQTVCKKYGINYEETSITTRYGKLKVVANGEKGDIYDLIETIATIEINPDGKSINNIPENIDESKKYKIVKGDEELIMNGTKLKEFIKSQEKGSLDRLSQENVVKEMNISRENRELEELISNYFKGWKIDGSIKRYDVVEIAGKSKQIETSENYEVEAKIVSTKISPKGDKVFIGFYLPYEYYDELNGPNHTFEINIGSLDKFDMNRVGTEFEKRFKDEILPEFLEKNYKKILPN